MISVVILPGHTAPKTIYTHSTCYVFFHGIHSSEPSRSDLITFHVDCTTKSNRIWGRKVVQVNHPTQCFAIPPAVTPSKTAFFCTESCQLSSLHLLRLETFRSGRPSFWFEKKPPIKLFPNPSGDRGTVTRSTSKSYSFWLPPACICMLEIEVCYVLTT